MIIDGELEARLAEALGDDKATALRRAVEQAKAYYGLEDFLVAFSRSLAYEAIDGEPFSISDLAPALPVFLETVDHVFKITLVGEKYAKNVRTLATEVLSIDIDAIDTDSYVNRLKAELGACYQEYVAVARAKYNEAECLEMMFLLLNEGCLDTLSQEPAKANHVLNAMAAGVCSLGIHTMGEGPTQTALLHCEINKEVLASFVKEQVISGNGNGNTSV
jgi:hypothetical protein